MKMNKRSRTIQTGLKLDVKPVSDKGLTEEEYRVKVADIQKQRQTQEALDKVAEQHFAQRKPRGPLQRRVVQRGLLAPEPRSSPFMGLLAIPDTGSKP
jgi:hypothetical protein